MFAISMVGMNGKPLYDPKYLRLIARYETKSKDGNWNWTEVPLLDCTEEDWAKFYPLDDQS